jgi:hypothetical protein
VGVPASVGVVAAAPPPLELLHAAMNVIPRRPSTGCKSAFADRKERDIAI